MTDRVQRPLRRRERRIAERAGERTRPKASPRERRFGLGAISAVALAVGAAVIAIAIALGGGVGSTAIKTNPATTVRLPAGLAFSGMVLGRPDAKVTIDLYEDFQCPACRQWSESTFPFLLSHEVTDGAARIVFHDMAFLGKESVDAGHAAYAAAQQNRFWDMWMTLYANQGPRENAGTFNRAALLAMAGNLGFDTARFAADMDSPAAAADLDASIAASRTAGVSSTPTLVINGQAYKGVGTYADLSAVIAAAAK
ncbi:MAG: thioredoxin domain-containing protein [Chloroflexota bacterium]